MKNVSFIRKCMIALVFCFMFTMLVSGSSGNQKSKATSAALLKPIGSVDIVRPYCLISNAKMKLMTGGSFDDPANATWGQAHEIQNAEADASAWGIRCSNLPWSYLYAHGAHWVYGNVNWKRPQKNTEYYKVEFNLRECSKLSVDFFVDDRAAFYIDGTGPASKVYDSSDGGFRCEKYTFESYCLEPGAHTLYIKHSDIHRVIYGLIFGTKCIPCQCCCNEMCGCFTIGKGSLLFYESCDLESAPITIAKSENKPDIYGTFQSIKHYFKKYPKQKQWCVKICITTNGNDVNLVWWQPLTNYRPPKCCPIKKVNVLKNQK
jgi:hypothetical protein